jgi:hypothetical protein
MSTSSPSPVRAWEWRTLLIAAAILVGVGDLIDAFFIDYPIVAIFAGVLFLVGAFLILRGGLGGVILVGILAVIEAVAVPFYDRDDVGDWIVNMVLLVASLIGVIASIVVLVEHGRTRRSRAGLSTT